MLTFGLILPSMRTGSGREVMAAGADAATRLGWTTLWATDHVLVPRAAADEYGRIYEAITTLAWVGAGHPGLRLGTSVIVAPQRNAVVLAKELATLDALSGGRVIAGVGVGWNETEYENLAAGGRFHRRGAYLDETIRLWRHLWSGSTEPFRGSFHELSDFVFEPLPDQGAALPILVGGRSPGALARAGRLADGYHASSTGPDAFRDRVTDIRTAAEAAGRSMPTLSARVNVRFEPAPAPAASGPTPYAMVGDAAAMIADVRAFAAAGVEHLAFHFEPRDPNGFVAAMERFDQEVIGALG